MQPIQPYQCETCVYMQIRRTLTVSRVGFIGVFRTHTQYFYDFPMIYIQALLTEGSELSLGSISCLGDPFLNIFPLYLLRI